MAEAKENSKRMRAADKRGALIEAGTRCIERLGMRACTMDDFAGEAGVSRITLYREFGNREEFVDAIHVQRFRRFNERFAARQKPGTPFAMMLETYLAETAEWVKGHEVTQQFARQPIDYTDPGTAMHQAALDFWGPALMREQASGLLPADFDLARTVQWLLVMQATVSRLAGDGKASAEVVRDLVRRFVLPAFKA